MNMLMFTFAFPVTIVGATVILYYRLGWPAFVGIFMMLLSLVINNCISKRNGELIKDINIYKDKRVQVCT